MAPPAASVSAPAPEPDVPGRRRRVGIAMLPTKAAKHLRPELIEAVGKAGYEIVPVVPGKLAEAGRLDALLHKIRTPAWKLELDEYSSRNPETLVLDPPDRVAALQSRATMLSPLQGSGKRFEPPQAVIDAFATSAAAASSSSSPPFYGCSSPPPPPPSPVVVAAPAQVVIPEGATAEQALAALSASGLSPPLLAKPLHAGATACGGSHALALLDDVEAVAALAEGRGLPHGAPPVVLQPYVRHPTPLFKVFVMGPLTVVARRPSLRVPPPPGDVTVSMGGAHAIARVSAYVSAEDGAEEEEGGREGSGASSSCCAAAAAAADSAAGSAAASPSLSPSPPFFEAPDPPRWALEALAAHLRASLGLNLFNFDLITVDKTKAMAAAAAENGGNVTDHSSSVVAASAAAAAPPGADYLVIDINYFPGFEKLPDYEGLLIEFLGWLFRPRTAGRIRGGSGGCATAAAAATTPGESADDSASASASSSSSSSSAAAAAAVAAEDLESKLRVGTAAAATTKAAAEAEPSSAPPAPSLSAAAPSAAAPSAPAPSASAPSNPSWRALASSAAAPAPPPPSLATASSAGSSPLRGAESAASLQKLARSLSQRPVTFPKVGGGGGSGGGIAAAAAAAVVRRDKEAAEKEKEKKSERSSISS